MATCPTGLPYSTTYQGIPVCSNVDPNAPQASGSHYRYQFKFSLPFTNVLALWGGTLEGFKTETIAQMAAQGHTVTNWQTSSPDPYTLQVDFDASSPPALIVIAIILGIFVVILYLVSKIIAQVSKNPLLTVGVAGLGIAAAVVAGFGLYLYFKR